MTTERAKSTPSDKENLGSGALLATKTVIPPTRQDLIVRPRLADELDIGLSRKLTVVLAPAGYGKTTLLSAWARDGRIPVAWVELDSADNDLSRFTTYLITALTRIDDGFGSSTRMMIQSVPPPSSIKLATSLINDLVEIEDDVTIVFDDYHVIENQDIHDTVSYLLDHLPPHAHLTVSARSDPPLPLASLRGAAELVELRAADLQFTPDEASAFLREAMGIDLPESSVVTLDRQVEGWAVGLQLAGLALKERDDARSFIDEFSGSHRYVVDFLADEVLQRQPDETRQFLLETSVLNSLTPALCDAVTNRKDSQRVLAGLEQANLFVFPLDDRREWFRYHLLFKDALRFRLSEQSDDEGIRELHDRATRWYETHGLESEALKHALLSEHFELAAALIEQLAEITLWRDTQWSTLLSWVEALPKEVLSSRPRLNLYAAWAFFTVGQWESVESVLKEVEAALDELDDPQASEDMRGEIATIRSWLSYEAGDLASSVAYAHVAHDLLHPENLGIRSIATFAQGMAAFWTGDMKEARSALKETISASRLTDNLTTVLMSSGALAELEVASGQLNDAHKVYEQVLELGRAKGDALLGPVGLTLVAMGEVLREWNDLETAEEILIQGLDLCEEQGGMDEFVLEGKYTLARIRLARGDKNGAAEAYGLGERLLADMRMRSGNVEKIILQALAFRARYWLAQGDLSRVGTWIEGGGLNQDVNMGAWHSINSLLRARLLLAEAKPKQAITLLRQLPESIQDGVRLELETGLLEAMVHGMLDDRERAQDKLAGVLRRAEPENYKRIFLDEAQALAPLLSRMIASSGSESAEEQLPVEYASELLRIINQNGKSSGAHPDLPESLTDRELSVLRLISAGLSNQEIADELVIALGTVKQYNHIIYRKLDVRTRSEATERAKELQLL